MTWAAAAGTKKRDQDGGKCAEGRKKNDAFLCGDILHSGVVTSDTEEEKLSYGDGPPGGVSERPTTTGELQTHRDHHARLFTFNILNN